MTGADRAPDGTAAATRRAWDRIWSASDLALEHATGEYERARVLRDLYLPRLPSDGVVLEAGCGVGTEMAALARRGVRTTGLDYSLPALAMLRRADPRAAVAAAQVERLPLADATVAAYLSFGVLEHFEGGPGPALAEAFRVLRPGGVLVATVPAPSLVWRAVRITRRWRRGPGAGYYETTYRPGELCALAAAAGFCEVRAVPVDHGFTLWGLGGPFRAPGHYVTSRLAEALGRAAARVAPRAMAFATMVTASKPEGVEE